MSNTKKRKTNRKCKRKQREHPLVTAMRKVYQDQQGIRELTIDLMYDEALDISEKNEKNLRDYIV